MAQTGPECGPANLSALLTSAIEEIESVAFWDLFPFTHATYLGVTVFLTTIPIWLAWEPMGNRVIGSQSPTPAKTECVRCSRAETWKPMSLPELDFNLVLGVGPF